MTDEDALSVIRFTLDRFMGDVPEERLLLNAIGDWRKQSSFPAIIPDTNYYDFDAEELHDTGEMFKEFEED